MRLIIRKDAEAASQYVAEYIVSTHNQVSWS